MPLPILSLIHYFYPILLAFPLPFSLTPASSPTPELPGITPVTVQKVTPRRTLILTLLALLVVTSLVDVGILVGDLLSARARYGTHLPAHLQGYELGGEIVYAIGGLLVWGIALMASLWRNKFGKALLVLGTLAVVAETVNLVWLVKREIRSDGWEQLFFILSLVPSSSRLLLFPLVLTAISSPHVSYESAYERTQLINTPVESINDRLQPNPLGASGYGTFTQSGSNTPSAAQQAQQQREEEERRRQKKIKINKQLGTKREPKKMLPWNESWPKFKKLVPKLWPSTSRKLQFHILITSVIILLERVLNPLKPITLGWLIEALSSWRYKIDVWKALGAYLGIRMISSYGILSCVEQYFWIPVVQYTDREMQMLCFNHLLDLSLSYHTRRNTGEVLRIIDRGSAINELLRTVLFEVIPTLSDTVIGFSVFVWLFGPTITFSILAVMVPYCLFSFYATRYSSKYRREYINTDVRQRGIVSDVLTNWESVKYFTSEQREVVRFEEAVDDTIKIDYQWRIGLQLIYTFQSLLLLLAFAIGAVLLAMKIMQGNSSAASFVIYITYFGQFTSPLNSLSSLYKTISSDIIDAEKLLTLLGEKTEIKDVPNAKELIITDGVVEFDNVTFSYDGARDAVKNISFKLDKGQSLALVGETGSGKSTVLRLLYRFYDVQSGHIYIDGQDISQVTQSSLRQAIGIVPQDSVLWNDSIGANIAYGKPDATDDEIIEAAQAGRIHDKIITFEDGYDTVVGERGVRLSGGEKQRVSLARMFLKSPAILVLDEATSALDTETERDIQKSLSKLAKGRTSLSIAHRLSTIINSDKIMVMKEGQLIEIGGYKDLIEKNGAFARMWRRQIYTEAELLEGDAVESFISALPTADEFRKYQSEEHNNGESKKDNPSTSNTPVNEVAIENSTSMDNRQTENIGSIQVEESDNRLKAKTSQGYELDPPVPIVNNPDVLTFAESVKTGPKTQSSEQAKLGTAGQETTEKDITNSDSMTMNSNADVAQEANLVELGGSTPTESPIAPTSTPNVHGPSYSPQAEQVSSPTTPRTVPFPSGPQRLVSHASLTVTPHHISTISTPSNTPSPVSREVPSPAKSETIYADSSRSATPDDKGDKKRKRLSSIKDFVRRISDQGGLARNASGLSSLKSPRVERERTANIGEDNEGEEVNETTSLLPQQPISSQSSAPSVAQTTSPKPISTHGGKNSRKDKKKKKSKH
ncbi:hypothetical protein L204_105732 [Cryptococcus depauperatus]|nr:ABC transporter [Cryptococcus depauperatus CBS 7855]